MSPGALALLSLLATWPVTARPARAQEAQLYSDSEKATNLRSRLTHLRIANLHVEVVGGMATLEGMAESLGDENDAKRIAKNSPGIEEVFDELRVLAVPDDDLQQSVEQALEKDIHYTVYDFVEAEARDGEIVLTGQATLPSDAEAIADTVSRVRGARAVTNDIRILPWSSSDERLREAVATAVYGVLSSSRVAFAPVRVVVEDGRVTLNGKLGDDRNIVAIAAAVERVPGVVSVENLLTRGKVESAT